MIGLGGELPLSRTSACTGEKGAYWGHTFFMLPGHRLTYKQVDLGRREPDVNDPARVIFKIRQQISKTFDIIPNEKLVAVGISRICLKGIHVGETRPTDVSAVLERVASFVIAASAADQEKILPLDRSELPNYRGIGSARRAIPHTIPINPLIHLPCTPEELLELPVEYAVKSLPARNLSNDPYVALHGTIEQILTPEILV